jgi:hypothetical protein
VLNPIIAAIGVMSWCGELFVLLLAELRDPTLEAYLSNPHTIVVCSEKRSSLL